MAETLESRRNALKKLGAAGAVAWTAPVILSRPAVAQGTPCCNFTITPQGLTCTGGVGSYSWLITNNCPTSENYRLDLAGCQTGSFPVTLAAGGNVTVTVNVAAASQPCNQTLTVTQLDAMGGDVCSSSDTQAINCPPGAAPGVAPGAATSEAPPEPGIVLTPG